MTHAENTEVIAGNAILNKASVSKKDEFYTTFEDIEKEMIHYTDYFSGKIVFCNCDNPLSSEFFRYFLLNFTKLGIQELRSSHYAYSSNSDGKAYIAQINNVPVFPDNSIDFDKLFLMKGNSYTQLHNDGDFRSDEVIEITQSSDVIITNPPFSLFRDFVHQLQELEKDFIILGNMNAVTYKEVFPLFRDNKIWYGTSIRSGDRKFYVPKDYPLSAAGCGVDEKGKEFIRVKGVRWFTNIDNGRRHEPIPLSKVYEVEKYPKYDNYDAINVGKTLDIPVGYDGIMGVPITFLDRYNPDQFEILMLANGNARTSESPELLNEVGYDLHKDDKGGVGIVNGKRVYVRILIRKV